MLCFLTILALSIWPGDDPIPACPGDRWPEYRGLGNSHSAAANLPVSWSEEENLAWTAELTGFGQSSPVVWKDRVFVTSVEGPKKERCIVSALRISDGSPLWIRSFPAGLEIESSGMVSRGAPTPAVDGERLYAFFESGDLFALDHDGELLWERSLGREYGAFQGNHGIASSPRLDEERLFLLVDHDGPGYLLGIDKRTGENLWKLDREPRVSWTTPTFTGDAAQELVVSSNGVLEGFVRATGELSWRREGIVGNTVASPTAVGDRIYVAASKPEGNALYRLGGEERQAEQLWSPSKARPSGFGAPLVTGEHVLVVNKSGALSCLDLESGELRWEQRLAESSWASPVAWGELVFFFGKEGTTTVLRPGEEGGEVVSENLLPTETTVYGVAIVDGSILLREGERLRCVRRALSAAAGEAAPVPAGSGTGG